MFPVQFWTSQVVFPVYPAPAGGIFLATLIKHCKQYGIHNNYIRTNMCPVPHSNMPPLRQSTPTDYQPGIADRRRRDTNLTPRDYANPSQIVQYLYYWLPARIAGRTAGRRPNAPRQRRPITNHSEPHLFFPTPPQTSTIDTVSKVCISHSWRAYISS